MNTNIVKMNGMAMMIENDDMVVKQAKENSDDGFFEPETFKFFMKECEQNTLFIDIGAYTGIYSISALNLGSYVSAFEPNNVVFSRLFQNVLLNKNVNTTKIQFSKFALGNENSSDVKFRMKEGTRLTSSGCIDDDNKGGEDIEVARLDDVGLFNLPVSLIKIDVEGSEKDVLEGAKETILKHKPSIICEVWDEKQEDIIVDMLQQKGYGMFRLLDERNLVAKYVG